MQNHSGLLVFGLLLLSPVLHAANSSCQQDNIHALIEVFPQLNELAEIHQTELEVLEDKHHGLFEQNEKMLQESLVTLDEHNEFQDDLEKEVIETAERQYAEFWELCTEITSK